MKTKGREAVASVASQGKTMSMCPTTRNYRCWMLMFTLCNPYRDVVRCEWYYASGLVWLLKQIKCKKSRILVIGRKIRWIWHKTLWCKELLVKLTSIPYPCVRCWLRYRVVQPPLLFILIIIVWWCCRTRGSSGSLDVTMCMRGSHLVNRIPHNSPSFHR